MERVGRILIVEDESEASLTVASFLEKRGFFVLTTPSGIEALAFIKIFKPDLLLLDICLSDLSGYDVLKSLRGYDKATKVIIMTGSGQSQEDIDAFVRLGISWYERKPLILENIKKLVYQSLGDMRDDSLKSQRIESCVYDHPIKDMKHELSNLLGIIRNQCENFILNIQEGFYQDKSSQELVQLSVEIMKNIEATVDRAVYFIEKNISEKKNPSK
ncbi:MAG TPA: response regulator [Candidatus Omnitrophota bacterium]|nr:response regulator [Candidatus Omnitrophota bacterium]